MNNNNTTTPPVRKEKAIFPVEGNESIIQKLMDEGRAIVTHGKLAVLTGTDSELRHAKNHIKDFCRGM